MDMAHGSELVVNVTIPKEWLTSALTAVRGCTEKQRRASKYDIQNRNRCITYWCGGVAYRCIPVLVRNYVDVKGADDENV